MALCQFEVIREEAQLRNLHLNQGRRQYLQNHYKDCKAIWDEAGRSNGCFTEERHIVFTGMYCHQHVQRSQEQGCRMFQKGVQGRKM